ncbi:MAG: ion channel [Alphaproteobacteria bacterium]|nr:ion channel [Alphaproteobacteria bacterium]
MSLGDQPRLVGLIFTGLLLGLISLAVAETGSVFSFVMPAIILAAVGSMYLLFPGSGFIVISLANFLGVYACIFIFFSTTNFLSTSGWVVHLGFVMPILAFLAGAWFNRQSLRYLVQSDRVRDERHLGRTFFWLLPVFGIGALTFFVPEYIADPRTVDGLFLAAMGAISVVVIFASHDVTTFLLDSGLLFEAFFRRSARLLVPAFAFLTFYSLLVIVFACIYRILDRFTLAHQFLVRGTLEEIAFSDALYFSVIAMSTVGFGDILPNSDAVEVLVAVQIVCGVLLLLFGFSEIITYARERRRDERH